MIARKTEAKMVKVARPLRKPCGSRNSRANGGGANYYGVPPMRQARFYWNGDQVFVRGYWRKSDRRITKGIWVGGRVWVASHWRKLPYPKIIQCKSTKSAKGSIRCLLEVNHAGKHRHNDFLSPFACAIWRVSRHELAGAALELRPVQPSNLPGTFRNLRPVQPSFHWLYTDPTR